MKKVKSIISTVFGRISCSRQLIFTAFNDKVETTPMGMVNLEYKTHLRLPVVGLLISSFFLFFFFCHLPHINVHHPLREGGWDR